METGILDAGGGQKAIFAAGVLDYMLDQHISPDHVIGVSAGSANLASFVASQRSRNYMFYAIYSQREEYMGLSSFFEKRQYFNLDYIYSTLSNSDGECPLDFSSFISSEIEYELVATDSVTAEAKYFGKEDFFPDRYDVLKASCAMPFLCNPVMVGGNSYFDGSLSDPIPIDRLLDKGCDKIVVLLNNPRSGIRTSVKEMLAAGRIRRKYPRIAKAINDRALLYNASLRRAEELEREGRALIVAPESTDSLDTFSRDADALYSQYEEGYYRAKAIKKFIG